MTKRIFTLYAMLSFLPLALLAHEGHGLSLQGVWHYAIAHYYLAPLIVVPFVTYSLIRKLHKSHIRK